MTETSGHNGDSMHGLNGDILVWNPVTRRRHELSSMDIRVNVSVTVWPKILKEICRENNIHVLE